VSLWDWAVSAYAAPGVADACLELQDVAGQNVPLLLWAGWTAAEGRPLDEEAVEAGCDTARVWSDTAIAPLRAVRRALKTPRPDMDGAAREAVRAQVKAVELDAERRLLEALEALSPAPAGPTRPPLQALVAVSRAWSERTPRVLLERLAERLPA
jgi:uncharacterized protein (TIGR02444 family)